MTSRPTRPVAASPRRLGEREDYWSLSSRPLHSLVFLLPLVLAYEIGSLLYLTDHDAGMQQTIRAKKLLDLFFSTFGVAALLITGIAMLAALLIWHVLRRDRWTVKPVVVLGMTLEAALWALPLVVLGAIVHRAAATLGVVPDGDAEGLLAAAQGAAAIPGGGVGAGAGGVGMDLLTAPWPARATIAIGAGIYEELLFRLVGIAVLHLVVKDLLQAGEQAARFIAIAGTSVAFALYHDVTLPGGGVQWPAFIFFFCAGVYFGTIYLARGFGIVVAVHAIYDLIALVLLPGPG